MVIYGGQNMIVYISMEKGQDHFWRTWHRCLWRIGHGHLRRTGHGHLWRICCVW